MCIMLHNFEEHGATLKKKHTEKAFLDFFGKKGQKAAFGMLRNKKNGIFFKKVLQ